MKKEETIDNVLIDQYVLIRTYSAGVFTGTLKKKVGTEVELKDARRIWYWDGAATLSELAEEGTSQPKKCKFPKEVSQIILTGVIEIIKVSDKAKNSINMVPIWEA